MNVQRTHLGHLVSVGGSTLGASGGARVLGSAGVVRGTGVIGGALGASGRTLGASGGARVLGSAGTVGGTIGGSTAVRAVGANVRNAGTARVLGGGVSAGGARVLGGGVSAGTVTDDLFNVVDRNHDGKTSRSEFRSGLKTGVINRGPTAVLPGR